MRKLLALAALILVLTSSVSGAATIKYSAFGNDRAGDCTFVAGANLVQHEYPSVQLNVNQVEGSWKAQGRPAGTEGISYLKNHGFGGHKATLTQLTNPSESDLIYDANHGGLYAFVSIYANYDHAIAVIGGNSQAIRAVWYGAAGNQSWKTWNHLQPVLYYSVSWNS